MSKMFPSQSDPVEMGELFSTFPNTIRPLCEYHDRLLRDWSPLTVGERELIAAYVSGLNACTFCHGAHTLAAQAFGIDEGVFEKLMDDPEQAPINPRLVPILAYVKKLTLEPAKVSAEDAAAVYAAGWDEQALFDAMSVCALFNFMNRIVEGSGMRSNPLAVPAETRKEMIRRFAGSEEISDTHEGPSSYTRLLDMWGIK